MTSLPLDDAAALFAALFDFFQVAVHSILYYRRLYPERAFLSATAFDVSVHQCRHPDVCVWVTDAVRHVMDQIAGGGVERVAVVVHAPDDPVVLERWVFDVCNLPAWPGGAAGLQKALAQRRNGQDTDYDTSELEADLGSLPPPNSVPATSSSSSSSSSLRHQLRGVVQRLAAAGTSLDPLPPRCTFSMAVEVGSDTALRPDADPPHPAWQPVVPTTPTRPAMTTTTLRTVHADPLFMECWVEESGRPGKSKTGKMVA